MGEYEIVNESTGEVEVFKSDIDIKQIEEYNQWRIDCMLNPPTYSAVEYAKYLEGEKAKEIVKRAKSFLEFYNQGYPFNQDMLNSLEDILDGKE